METRKIMLFSATVFFLATFSILPVRFPSAQESTGPSQPVYDFRIETGWITMPDGVRLSATYYHPVLRVPDEKFPVVFEFLPYRKDDSGYN
jgi:predicted acyl esterase